MYKRQLENTKFNILYTHIHTHTHTHTHTQVARRLGSGKRSRKLGREK